MITTLLQHVICNKNVKVIFLPPFEEGVPGINHNFNTPSSSVPTWHKVSMSYKTTFIVTYYHNWLHFSPTCSLWKFLAHIRKQSCLLPKIYFSIMQGLSKYIYPMEWSNVVKISEDKWDNTFSLKIILNITLWLYLIWLHV